MAAPDQQTDHADETDRRTPEVRAMLVRCWALAGDDGGTLTEGARQMIAGMVLDWYRNGPDGFTGWQTLPAEARSEWAVVRWAFGRAPTTEGRDALETVTRELDQHRPGVVLPFRSRP